MQWVAETGKHIVGALYTQRIADIGSLRCGSFRTQLEIEVENGSIAQLCYINALRSSDADIVSCITGKQSR